MVKLNIGEMVTANAQLIFHTQYDFRGNIEQIICEWDGPKDGIVGVSGICLDEVGWRSTSPNFPPMGEVIEIGPYKLKAFERDVPRDVTYFIRQDSIVGRLRATIYHITRSFDLIYRRLIITASVWKLADYEPGKIPAWQDLHIVQRIRDLCSN